MTGFGGLIFPLVARTAGQNGVLRCLCTSRSRQAYSVEAPASRSCHSVYDDKDWCQETKCTHDCVTLRRRAKGPGRCGCQHRHNLRAFPLLRRVLLLGFLTSLMPANSQRCCNHSLSFHQPCIRSLIAIMIVLANSHLLTTGGRQGAYSKARPYLRPRNES